MSLRGRHLRPSPPPRRHSPAAAAYRFAVVAVPGAVLMTTLMLTMGIGEDLSTRWEERNRSLQSSKIHQISQKRPRIAREAESDTPHSSADYNGSSSDSDQDNYLWKVDSAKLRTPPVRWNKNAGLFCQRDAYWIDR